LTTHPVLAWISAKLNVKIGLDMNGSIRKVYFALHLASRLS
jgi:hypothetical protein